MSFWAGFAAGIAATYGFSIGVVIGLVLIQRRAERRAASHAEHLCHILGYDPASGESWSPEYPTVRFTHLSSVGPRVRGGDG
jgi:hypothetical protein